MNPIIPEHVPAAAPNQMGLGRYWKKILGNIPNALTVYDETGEVVYANEMAAANLRYASVEILMNQNITDIAERFTFYDINDNLLEIDELPVRRAFRDQKAVEMTFHCVPVDGIEDFWLVAKAFPIITNRHLARFVVSTYHDVTTFKASETQLKAANRRMLQILDDLMTLDQKP